VSIDNQCEQILKYLKNGQTLTAVEALDRFGCFRLAARVSDLRDQGHQILTSWESNGEKRWARYSI
jgi:hypothetical protein